MNFLKIIFHLLTQWKQKALLRRETKRQSCILDHLIHFFYKVAHLLLICYDIQEERSIFYLFLIFFNKHACFIKQPTKDLCKERLHQFPTALFTTSDTLTSPPLELKSCLTEEGFALVSLRTHDRGNELAGVQLRTDFGLQIFLTGHVMCDGKIPV